MIFSCFARGTCKRNFLKPAEPLSFGFFWLQPSLTTTLGRSGKTTQARAGYSSLSVASDTFSSNFGERSLAHELACLVDETSTIKERKPRSRTELKRSLELRVKKRVKVQFIDGKFHSLLRRVLASRETLEDAYNCICLNSDVDCGGKMPFDSLAEDLQRGSFDVSKNIFSISTRGARKEVLVLPSLKLKVIQEAIRLVLEVVYKPHFSKISHGCRSGRGHSTALKYISKEISNPDWWFTLNISKKLDSRVFSKLISIMEEKIDDPELCSLLRSMFDARVINLEFGGFPKGHGLPQEGVLSPILINIYLDQFDREFYRLSMAHEALGLGPGYSNQTGPASNLRNWFRRQLKGNVDTESINRQNSNPRIHSCRHMDEMFFAVNGPKDIAVSLKSEVVNYLQEVLFLEADDQAEIFPCNGRHGIQFLGLLVRRKLKESPAVRAVHKLKEKVELFASQKEAAWDAGTVRIGKKWLAHGLKKVKESEIKSLADENSVLSRISSYRKAGMETDHWYKHLLKIWMQNVNAKVADSEEIILSKYIAEPSLPRELTEAFYRFQKCAKEYVSSETASTLALLPNSPEAETITEIVAPVEVIKKRLLRYGLMTSRGFGRSGSLLILLDRAQIIEWYSGIVRRWLRWYRECNNFDDVKVIVYNCLRKSCIRTLAAKYRVHETEVEKRFDLELSRIPSTIEVDQEEEEEDEDQVSQVFENDEALNYGILYSGACLLSLARSTIASRPCDCFTIGCTSKAPSVYTINVMGRERFPGWKTGFSSCIHPSLNRRRIGLCDKHLKDLFSGRISLQSIEFGAWRRGSSSVDSE
ncbi:hypothetical protein CDL15_Pgr028238 [Punica granatum]|uniref:Domain X domain-containing protein n=1 Tax=Punica granatum TaxID=22663 RepID=A0A218WV41_PUNGR|nr:hypothetical protein CDL15_Pgr028238 [Punica granatum]